MLFRALLGEGWLEDMLLPLFFAVEGIGEEGVGNTVVTGAPIQIQLPNHCLELQLRVVVTA